MSQDPPSPPVKSTRGEPSEGYGMSFSTLILIRLYAMLLDVLSRLGDLAVLLWRPRLLLPYLGLWLREAMYGETPVHTALWLFWKAGLGKGGQLVDLGAGRGRTLLAARWLGAGARGVELL